MRVRIKLANPETRDGVIDVEDALVDTGATWTTVPRGLAQQLGLRVIGKMAVKTAAGPQTLDQSYAYIELAGKSMVTPLLLSDVLEGVLIGVITLEAMGLAVDPVSGQLKESEVFLLTLTHHRVDAARSKLPGSLVVGEVVRPDADARSGRPSGRGTGVEWG